MQNMVVEVHSEGGDEEDSVLASLKRHNEEDVMIEQDTESIKVLPPIDVTKVSVASASIADIEDNQGPKHITSG